MIKFFYASSFYKQNQPDVFVHCVHIHLGFNILLNSQTDCVVTGTAVEIHMMYLRRQSTTFHINHYADVIMIEIASQITSVAIVYSIVYSDAVQRKHQSSASLAFVREIHRGPVNSPHKWPVTRKIFPFDDVIMMTRFSLSQI